MVARSNECVTKRIPMLEPIRSAAAAVLLLCAVARAQVTERVSVATGGAEAIGASYGPASVSADGRFIAFRSDATNLVAGDTNGASDIFVRDRITNTTTRISVSSTGTQANNTSSRPSISANGRYVAFESYANNLVAGDTNFSPDIFVHDRVTATTTRVSLSTAGAQGDGGGTMPSISADGEWVAFTSQSSTLVPLANNFVNHVFLRHRPTGVTTLISVTPSGGLENGASDGPTLSADGRFIAFNSSSNNLVASPVTTFKSVYVRDRLLGTTVLASKSLGGGAPNETCDFSSISANGRVVAFHTQADNLVPLDTNFLTDVFAYELDSGITERISVSSANVQGNAGSSVSSQATALSADGRYVVFMSWASNFVTFPFPPQCSYVRDRALGTTILVNPAASAAIPNGWSALPTISSDGRHIVFPSQASNLVGGDGNSDLDIFIRSPYSTPWAHLGQGLAGITGIPNLIGTGTLIPGTPGSLILNSARPSSPALLFVSFSSTPTPLACGSLVPFPFALTLTLPTDAAGSLAVLWAAWPSGVSGLSFYFQYVIADPAATCGAAFSNALRGDAP
jgi:Tol biopolymer transport system component